MGSAISNTSKYDLNFYSLHNRRSLTMNKSTTTAKKIELLNLVHVDEEIYDQDWVVDTLIDIKYKINEVIERINNK